MTVSGNLVTALDGLANGIGIELGAGGIGTDRAGCVEAIENAHDAPETFVAAILAPGNAGMIDDARLERRGLN